ncbi:MAG: ABC transporter substrate-binding protein [Rhodospirillales bacterium]|nr:ABC transporter substrate-binding protein [Rhodospirillales bacterium]
MKLPRLALLGLLLGAATALPPAARAATFRWANNGDVTSMDPDTLQETVQLSFLANIYEPMVQRDANLKLIPGLAVKWEQISPTVWRFHLRPGVKWQDGTPFTADDVVFSFQRIEAKTAQMRDTLGMVKEIKKVGPLTVDVVTKRPDPIFPQEQTNFLIMSKAWCEKHDATVPVVLGTGENYAILHAMGTGPYELVSRQPDSKTILKYNKNWWGKLTGNVTRVEFDVIKNDSTRVAALLSGAEDMVYTVPPQDMPRIAHAPGVHLVQHPELRTIYFGFDMSRPQLLTSNVKGKNPFQDIRVRRAFALAIDEDLIAKRVMLGQAHPTWLMWGPGVNGYDPKLDVRPKTNIAEAKKLMAEAGYPHGFTLGMDCPDDRYVMDEQICTAAAAMLGRIGVKVNLDAQTKAKFFAKINVPKYDTDFYMLGWTPSTYDAENVLYSLLGSRNGKRGIFNVGGYSNPKLDKLIDEIGVETNQTKRDALIDDAARILQHDLPTIPLHQQVIVWAVRNGYKVVQPADNSFPFRYFVAPGKQ